MLMFSIPNHGLDAWFERVHGQEEGEIVVNKTSLA
jgi:hypothetical protein